MARHSSIRLTMDLYTPLDQGDLSDALQRLPALSICQQLDESETEVSGDLVAITG